MADFPTPLLGLVAPEDGASPDTWGLKLNEDLAKLDTFVGVPVAAFETIPDSGIIDLETGGVWAKTLSADISLSFTNSRQDDPTTFATKVLILLNNEGDHAVTWPAEIEWINKDGTAPVLRVADKWELVLLISTGEGATIYGLHLNTDFLPRSGGTMTGDIDMDGFSILGELPADAPTVVVLSSSGANRSVTIDLSAIGRMVYALSGTTGAGGGALTLNFSNRPVGKDMLFVLNVENTNPDGTLTPTFHASAVEWATLISGAISGPAINVATGTGVLTIPNAAAGTNWGTYLIHIRGS